MSDSISEVIIMSRCLFLFTTFSLSFELSLSSSNTENQVHTVGQVKRFKLLGLKMHIKYKILQYFGHMLGLLEPYRGHLLPYIESILVRKQTQFKIQPMYVVKGVTIISPSTLRNPIKVFDLSNPQHQISPLCPPQYSHLPTDLQTLCPTGSLYP